MYLGIDLGTSKIAVVLYNEKENKIIFSSSYAHNALKIKDKFYEIDPEKIKRICFDIFKNIPYKKEIKGIGISTQMHGCLIVDKNFNPLTPLITWEDKRTLLSFKYNKTYIEYIKDICKNIENTGTTISTGFMGATIFYLKENNPDLFRKENKVCFLGDYIASCLTKEKVKTDITCAGSSGIFDIVKKDWLWDIIEKLKIPNYIFPEVLETGEILGLINKKIAKELGINEKCKVAVSIGDNQASILGCAGYLRNKIVLNIGTGSQISENIGNYKEIKYCDTRYFIKNNYIAVGAGLSGGKTLKILEKFLKEIGEKIFNKKEPSLYKKMHEIAEKNKSNNNIITGTFFSGSRIFPEIKGFIINLSEENFKLENFIFSFYLGVIFELYFYYRNLSENKGEKIIGSGNGFRKNPLFAKISSSIFNLPVSIPLTKEEAATGTCLVIAEKLSGIDIEEFIRDNTNRDVYYPDKNLKYLQQLYDTYEDTIKNLTKIF